MMEPYRVFVCMPFASPEREIVDSVSSRLHKVLGEQLPYQLDVWEDRDNEASVATAIQQRLATSSLVLAVQSKRAAVHLSVFEEFASLKKERENLPFMFLFYPSGIEQ